MRFDAANALLFTPRLRRVLLGLAIAAISPASPPISSAEQRSAHETYTISDNVDLVLLDASVKHPHGGYVTGLSRSRFKVYEDGHPRTITHFASVDAPVTVGLVVDESGSMRLKRRDVAMAGLAFAKQSNRQDEFFVVNFSDRAYYGLPAGMNFTDNMGVLRSALFLGEPAGRTALYDALAFALKHLERSHHEIRTLVLVSDGGDNSSSTRFPELVDMIQASRATIYSVGLLDPGDGDINPRMLKKLASITGGEFFAPAGLDEILPVFEKISKDIRSRYTIGFTPDEEHDRRIVRKVKLVAQDEHGRRLQVRTRGTYRVTPLNELAARQSGRDRQQGEK